MATRITDEIRSKLHDNCPACGSAVNKYQEETIKDLEWWEYDCGAGIVITEQGVVEENDHCRNALMHAIAKLGGEKIVTTIIETA